MHSKIFQIETFPVEPDCCITEDNYIGDHWFVHSIADYVAADENHAESLEWLKTTLSAGGNSIEFFSDENGGGFILHDGFQAAYFATGFRAFHDKLLSLVERATPEAFADGSLQSPMFSFEEVYENKYGFYVDSDETGLVTLNYFLRNAKLETRYYFGGIVDYHY